MFMLRINYLSTKQTTDERRQMATYSDVKMNVWINDKEQPAMVQFDYEPEENSVLTGAFENAYQGSAEELDITSIVIQPTETLCIDLMDDKYSWLVTRDLITELEESALEFVKAEAKEILQDIAA